MEQPLQPVQASGTEAAIRLRETEEQNSEAENARRMETQERTFVLQQLELQAYRSKRISRLWRTVDICASLIFLPLWLMFWRSISYHKPGLTEHWFVFCFVFFVLMHLARLLTKRTLNKWGKSTREIAWLEDVRSVGALAEALDIDERAFAIQVELALAKLLPRLQASDASLLNERQRLCLYRCLTTQNANKKREFTLTVLKAVEQIGDEKAIPYVEKLLPVLPQPAEQCLSSLRIHAEEQRASSMLLRASSETMCSTDTLLRPANETASTKPQQLLRAATEESPNKV